MKIDLEASNILYREMSVDVIRDDFDTDEVYSWLDEAQGEVFSGKQKKMYVVIEVS